MNKSLLFAIPSAVLGLISFKYVFNWESSTSMFPLILVLAVVFAILTIFFARRENNTSQSKLVRGLIIISAAIPLIPILFRLFIIIAFRIS